MQEAQTPQRVRVPDEELHAAVDWPQAALSVESLLETFVSRTAPNGANGAKGANERRNGAERRQRR